MRPHHVACGHCCRSLCRFDRRRGHSPPADHAGGAGVSLTWTGGVASCAVFVVASRTIAVGVAVGWGASVGRYVVVRLYSMALTLMGLSVLVFLMLRLVPGTVVEQMIGADAIVSPQMVAELKRFFGLDQPWWRQYAIWVGSLAHGDLGTSWRTGHPV